MTTTPTLINITNELTELYQLIKLQDGQLTPEQELKFTLLLQQSKEKVTGYCNLMEHIEQEAMYIDQRIKEALAYKQRLLNTQDNLKRCAKIAIEMTGRKLEGEFGKWVNLRKSTSVNVTSPSSLPHEYVRTVTTYQPDKLKIKADIELGKEVPGAELVEKESVVWR